MAWKSIPARSRARSRPSLGHRMKALKQRPPRYRRLSLVTKPRSSAPTRGLSCAAVAMAARKRHRKQRPDAIGGGCCAARSRAVPFTPRCVIAAPWRIVLLKRQPYFCRACGEHSHSNGFPRGIRAPSHAIEQAQLHSQHRVSGARPTYGSVRAAATAPRLGLYAPQP